MKQVEELKIDEYKNDGNFVLNECIDWYNKYIETYDSFRRIQEERKKLQIITTISKEQIEKEKSKYSFSINLVNTTTGQYVLEGPRISMDSKNEKAGRFLMAAITTSYITLNPDFHTMTVDGLYARLEHNFTKSTLDVTKAIEDDVLSSTFTDILRLDYCAVNENKKEQMKQILFSTYQAALKENMEIDDALCKSVDENDQHYLAVKRYLQKRK